MRINTEQQAIQYLESLVDVTKKVRGSDIHVEPVLRLLRLLGNPEQHFPAVYISGTSGKGSTATFIASILSSAGFRTGLVLSPHVEEYRERFQLNRHWISQSDFARVIQKTANVIELEKKKNVAFRPTIFEVLVAAQFLYFASKHIDIAVIESGVGGDRDATTTCQAIVDVITTVALEHQSFLGKTLTAIARTERTAFHPNALRVIGRCPKRARSVLLQTAGRDCIDVSSDVIMRSYDLSESGTRCTFMVEDKEYQDLRASLIGTFQPWNMALAVATVHQLRKKHWEISERAIRIGISRARIRDRFELVRTRGRTVIFDGAHNPEKMRAFVTTFQRMFGDQKATALVAFKRGKDVRSMARILSPICSRLVITTMHMPHVDPKKLQRIFCGQGFRGRVSIEPNPTEASKMVRRDQLIVVTGSMYLYSNIRKFFPNV